MTNNLEELSDSEKLVLGAFQRTPASPYSEEDFHMIMSILEYAGKGPGFKFEIGLWTDIDERYQPESHGVSISRDLHDTVEGLVEKGYLVRDEENPLLIYNSDDAPTKN